MGCHAEGNIGPFSLTTYEEVYEARELVKVAVASRTMPPWLADEGCEDYRFTQRLTDEQVDTIVRWVDLVAHEGNPTEVARPSRTGTRASSPSRCPSSTPPAQEAPTCTAASPSIGPRVSSAPSPALP